MLTHTLPRTSTPTANLPPKCSTCYVLSDSPSLWLARSRPHPQPHCCTSLPPRYLANQLMISENAMHPLAAVPVDFRRAPSAPTAALVSSPLRHTVTSNPGAETLLALATGAINWANGADIFLRHIRRTLTIIFGPRIVSNALPCKGVPRDAGPSHGPSSASTRKLRLRQRATRVSSRLPAELPTSAWKPASFLQGLLAELEPCAITILIVGPRTGRVTSTSTSTSPLELVPVAPVLLAACSVAARLRSVAGWHLSFGRQRASVQNRAQARAIAPLTPRGGHRLGHISRRRGQCGEDGGMGAISSYVARR